MGWYSDLKESDWFQATKDVADGISSKYEEIKHQQAPAQQAQVLTQTESTQQAQAELQWNPQASGNQQVQAQESGFNKNYLIAGGAVVAGLAVLLLAVR